MGNDKLKNNNVEPATRPKTAVFIMRGEGQSFAEFKKVCIQRFKDAGLIKEEDDTPSPENLADEQELQDHKRFKAGLQDLFKLQK